MRAEYQVQGSLAKKSPPRPVFSINLQLSKEVMGPPTTKEVATPLPLGVT
jgi:hypothetical protein